MSIEDFEDVYVAHIPRIASLNVSLASRILRKLERYPKWSFTKRIIEDCIAIGHCTNQYMVSEWQKILLNFPIQKLSETELDEYRDLVERLIDIWKELNSLNDERQALKDKRLSMKNTLDSVADSEVLAEEAETKKSKGKRELMPNIDYEFFKEELIRRGHLKSFD